MRLHFTSYNKKANRSYYEAYVFSNQTSGYSIYAGKQKLIFRARDDVNQIEIIFNDVPPFSTVPFSEIQRTVTAYMKTPSPTVAVPLATCYRELEQRIDKLLIRML